MTHLTDLAIRRAKPAAKAYTLKDGCGLFLNIKSNGTKQWLYRFYWESSQTRISLGNYPSVDLRKARSLRQQAQDRLADSLHPREDHQPMACTENLPGIEAIDTHNPTFATFVQEWLTFKLKKLGAKPSKEKKNGGRQSTEIQIERYLRLDMLPVLGHLPMKSITRTHLLAVQSRIENRGALSIAEKVRTWLNEIFRYAVATEVIESNPAADMDIVALPYRRIKRNPFLHMHEMPELMAKLHNYKGERQTELGIRLLLLTGVRTGELRFADISQFDLQNALWRIPVEDVKQLQRIKLEKDQNVPDYIVPLPKQAVEIIKELLSYRFPNQRYLLCHRTRPHQAISENTLNAALKREGFKNRLTGHGIRATLSTALNELEYNKDWIEAQLSHSDKDRIRATYNHAMYVEQRRTMMQDWADKLDAWEMEGVKQMKPQ